MNDLEKRIFVLEVQVALLLKERLEQAHRGRQRVALEDAYDQEMDRIASECTDPNL